MTEIETALTKLEYSKNTLLESCNIAVLDTESEALAAQMLISIRTELKRIEAERKSWTDPLEQQKKRIIEGFKKIAQPLEEAETNLIVQLTSYRAKLMEIARKEEARLLKLQEKRNQKAAENGKPPPLPETIIPYVETPDKSIHTQNGKLTYTTRWKAKVVDINLVPTFYNGAQILQPDTVALDKMAALNKGQNPPPGIEFYQETFTRVS